MTENKVAVAVAVTQCERTFRVKQTVPCIAIMIQSIKFQRGTYPSCENQIVLYPHS